MWLFEAGTCKRRAATLFLHLVLLLLSVAPCRLHSVKLQPISKLPIEFSSWHYYTFPELARHECLWLLRLPNFPTLVPQPQHFFRPYNQRRFNAASLTILVVRLAWWRDLLRRSLLREILLPRIRIRTRHRLVLLDLVILVVNIHYRSLKLVDRRRTKAKKSCSILFGPPSNLVSWLTPAKAWHGGAYSMMMMIPRQRRKGIPKGKITLRSSWCLQLFCWFARKIIGFLRKKELCWKMNPMLLLRTGQGCIDLCQTVIRNSMCHVKSFRYPVKSFGDPLSTARTKWGNLELSFCGHFCSRLACRHWNVVNSLNTFCYTLHFEIQNDEVPLC